MRRRTFALLQISAWTLYGLVHYLAALPAVSEQERWHLAGWKAIRALTGCLVSSALPFLYRRLPGGLERGGVVIVKATVVSYTCGFFWAALDRALLVTLVAMSPLDVNWDRFPRGFDLDYVFVLLAWSAAYLAVRYASLAAQRGREALEQEVLARESQLQALAFQLSPHFLFNALNSIRALVAEDAERARTMITRLADFLRHGLHAAGQNTVAQELEAARAYLGIEKARFEERLETTIESSAEAESCLLPTRLLQPLVENAVKHGDARAGAPLVVRVQATLLHDTLRIEVANSGTLASGRPDADAPPLGLANLRSRLALAYGERQRFALEARDGWVVASVEIREPDRDDAARADR